MWLWREARRVGGWAGVTVMCLLGARVGAAEGESSDLPPLDVPRLPARWDTLFGVQGGAGFRDNVTLAAYDPASAGFIYGQFDGLVNRLSLDASQLTLFADGFYRQYLSGPVDDEQTYSGMAEWKQPLGTRWEVSVAAQGLYLDQVMDVSFTETNRSAVRVRGPALTLRPGARLDLAGNLWAAVELPVTRRLLDEPLDDQWEGSLRLAVGRDYGWRSDLQLSYEPLWRAYDNATDVTEEGVSIPGTHRTYLQHELRLAWRHHWDERRRWRTKAWIGLRLNQDNAAGYFDFTKLYSSVELRYRAGRWELTAEARASWYSYDVQTVSPTDPRLRENVVAGVSLRCERELLHRLKAVAEYEFERVLSNDRFEQYTVNTVSGGLRWEF